MTNIRARRPLDRKVHVRDAKLIFVAVEGRETEAQYLEMFRHGNAKFSIVVVKPNNDASAPQHVLAKLKEELGQKGFDEETDEAWIMVDVDHGTETNHIGNMRETLQQAVQAGYNLALSNPCFECWLIMHHGDPPQLPQQQSLSNDYKGHLRTLIGGYNESNVDIEKFRLHVEVAIARAKQLDYPPADRIPNYPGSHVYKLVEKLK